MRRSVFTGPGSLKGQMVNADLSQDTMMSQETSAMKRRRPIFTGPGSLKRQNVKQEPDLSSTQSTSWPASKTTLLVLQHCTSGTGGGS